VITRVEPGQVLAAALGALLPAVDDAGEDGFQPLDDAARR
jgi:hypothetical protein